MNKGDKAFLIFLYVVLCGLVALGVLHLLSLEW
jgi:hypothetical protein